MIVLDLAAYGTDQITGLSVDTLSSEQPDAIQLQAMAQLTITSIINPGSVVRGQDDVLDTLLITNNGGATARITDATIRFKNGNTYYNREVISPLFPFDLTGGATDTVFIAVDVLLSAPLGIDSLAGQVQAFELNRGVSVGITSGYLSAWEVTGEGAISILSVVANRSQVSAGQDSINVNVRLRNQGSTTIRVDSLQLQFANGISNYAVTGPTPAVGFDMLTGVDTTLAFQVDALPTAQTGLDTIDARLVATEILTVQQFVITGAINPETWTVQSRPQMVIDSVLITPSVASTGQNNLNGPGGPTPGR